MSSGLKTAPTCSRVRDRSRWPSNRCRETLMRRLAQRFSVERGRKRGIPGDPRPQRPIKSPKHRKTE
ncbi:hypothetical protein JEQ12_002637 [Ovis aries]|uniref:Uncharacterized protein n=1 Tax=Ovis aries TaxID=9940 RepID=A0A836CXR6_SHEEP|nr:hypothetical protein JEQ12_002637 [Ovis aries]